MKYKYDGLNDKEVLESRAKNGDNSLPTPEAEGFWDKFKSNFKDPLIIILCIALVLIFTLSIFGLAEWYEAVGIGVAVLLATFVATFSEYKNEESFQKLQEEASMIKNQVFRNSTVLEIAVSEIVVGDLVLLQSGVKIPADGILIDGNIKVSQASLTGESEALTKIPFKGEKYEKELDLADENAIFRGAVVEDGEAVMLVKRVGENSFYGKLSKELAISDDSLSPLQLKLEELAGSISKFGYIGAALVFLVSLFDKILLNNHFSLDEMSVYFTNWGQVLNDIVQSLVFSVVLIVAAVPEGLPMMVAIVLSLNMRKLLAAKVLVRKLLGIETAGSLNILFSDKTGTITKGQLEVSYFFTANNDKFSTFKEMNDNLEAYIAKSIVFNTSSFLSNTGEVIGGNSSERAILSFVDRETILKYQKEDISIIENLPFNSSIKYSATKVNENNNTITFIKGAPEILLKNCSRFIDASGKIIEGNDFNNIVAEMDILAENGYRLLSLAISDNKNINLNELSDLTLLGFLAVRDEIRKESHESIQKALEAGIQVVMITGDRKGTAVSIAKEVGLVKSETDVVLTSDELAKLSDAEVEKIIPNLRVIARALPTDKSRLVRISKKLGLVTGMTGDGVNDAPALKQADISFAMGSGSEVSKEASDIVILDDNFNSIVNAILYGRNIFKSIRKFIIFQLTVNVSAVFISFIGAMFNMQPITVIQLLWINVIMDTLAAIAFGGEPALKRYLKEKPISKTENIISPYMRSAIFTNGVFIISMSFIFLKSGYFTDIFNTKELLITGFFNYFIFSVIINGFNTRSETMNILEHIKENNIFIYVMSGILVLQAIITFIGGKLLNVVPLNAEQWIVVILLSLLIIPFDLLRKFLRKTSN